MSDSRPPALVLDFDGTVCLGDAPVLAYVEAVIKAAGPAPEAGLRPWADSLRTGVADFLSGGADGVSGYADGYAAVAALAGNRVDPQSLSRAYLTSREALASGAAQVSAPGGLVGLLAGLEGVERVLLTNAPPIGVTETLQRLGLTAVLDRIVTDADKPAGWDRLLPELLQGRSPAALLSVGDVWANDCAAPLAAGATVGLIDRFGRRREPAHLVAPDLPSLYPAIQDWAADPRAFQTTHPLPAPHHGAVSALSRPDRRGPDHARTVRPSPGRTGSS